ncbi:PA14 domain-containing protein [Gramella sp. AN32]|uniref:PA14 domain-containing protein n=1 Tax=Christiangramia antarctica TaxID=2058158 RepID=A0ABW5X0N1_9FLAO|nr:PA14 domain-containing protein [Gramella sp. AN32]MCM4156949.1 hypothetical protein [Gramella sp. AN32]
MKNNYVLKFAIMIIVFISMPNMLRASDETVLPGDDIQAAIDNVAASGGGTVTLAAGTHNITTPVRMKSNVTLQGEGNWASLLKTTVNMKMIIADAEGLVNLTIQNLAIEGTNALNGGGIEIASLGVDNENIKILNVHCSKTGWGVHVKGAKNLLVKDCLFEENGTVGKEGYAHNMYLRRVYGAEVRDSQFLNSISANGVNISYSEDIKIYNCEMSGNYFRGVRAANTEGYLVYDCIVENNGNVGILANSEGVPTTNIDIRRNCVSNNTLEGIRGVNGVTGIVADNNSYANSTDYSLPGTVTQSGNITDASIDCEYAKGLTRVLLNADPETEGVKLSWVFENITVTRQDIFRDTDSNASGRALIASRVNGTSFTDNTAVAGTPYWYWVKVTDASSQTTNSNAASATLSGGDPSVTLNATSGDGFVTLNWDIENINAEVVGLFRDTDDNASGRKLVANYLNGSTYTDNSVENGTEYWYWLKVTDDTSTNYQNDPATYAFPGASSSAQAQFVHPGISHKKSDLDRMKYMVEAEIDPWYTSYQNMVADSKSSYNYEVRGNESFTELGRDSGVNYGAWNSDIRAAYYNAIRWYITGDTRHADKAVEIFKAWSNLTSVTSGGTESLSGGVAYIMIEAAEIIKSTYPGWSSNDIQAFKDMLVYPGYSNTTVPEDVRNNATFYWKSYQGDPVRHGNQGLSGWRTVMAMGIFLDNEIMYDRALRYIKGQPHRPDDLPYPPGPNTSTTLKSSGEHADTYNISRGSSIEDYGYNEVMTNYIYENGQSQESSRDQDHVLFGLGLLSSMAEMAWNQGEDLYSHEDSRLLEGLEFSLRYNVSYQASYPDQTSPWEPTNFIQGFDRTGRWYSKSMSPEGRGDFTKNRPSWEMSTAHYIGRGIKSENDAKWTQRARDKSIEIDGYEKAGWTNDAIGWGGLTFRRPEGCYGDPISGFSSGFPNYNMNILSGTIEAENFDYSPVSGESRIYKDNSSGNSGGVYRADENVDISKHAEGGYILENIEAGEWITYTVYVPVDGTYDISLRYAAANANGKIKFNFGGTDVTEELAIPYGGSNSTGISNWKDFTVASDINLTQGVQPMKIMFSGESESFNLDNFTISLTGIACQTASSYDTPVSGINYRYYEGNWDQLPEFQFLTPVKTGVASAVDLSEAERTDNFGFVFEGYIKVPTNGDYTFYTTSDDGSSLSIDDIEIVDNNGVHSAQEASGNICLDAGFHKIKVAYFQATDSHSLGVQYEGPGISKTTLSNLYASPVNLALNGIATQSSTAYNGPPELAIDGNIDGNYGNGSVTHTENGTTGSNTLKWWQVDLGADKNITEIRIFNRSQPYSNRLKNIVVYVYDSKGVERFKKVYTDGYYPNPSEIIYTDGVVGKIVRIEKTSDYGMTLAEVEVYGGALPELEAQISAGSEIICNGSETDLAAKVEGGVVPYTYLWSNGETTETITGLGAGTYSVEVQDALENTATAEIIIEEFEAIFFDLGEDQTYYQGYDDSTISLMVENITGGSGTYTYLWSTGATTRNIEVTPEETTTFTLEVTDENGCTVSDNVTVNVQDVTCGKSSGDKKIEICFNGNSLCVARTAIPIFLNKGASLGNCDVEKPVVIQELEALPNPTNGPVELKIVSARKEKVSIEVYNLSGIMVIHNQIQLLKGENLHHLNLGHEINGIFIVLVKGSGFVTDAVKIIKN